MNFDTLYIISNNRRIRAFFKESDDVVVSENPGRFHELELEEHIRTPDAGNSSPSDRDGRFEKGNAIDRPQGYASG
ncbi:MAG: hypothetical protein P1V20_16910 [Verrucomicrobiales bacterium]|nr:hypothetical protein [Verrucomicrobiales bacterium]